MRAWCDWCDKHDLPALPASPADVAAFLSEQRYPAPPGKPLGVSTLKLRAAAIRYLHYLARLPSPTGSADVSETLTGINRVARQAGQAPRPKLAARVAILREMTAAIGDDLPGLRDSALLLLGFAGAFRRAELARIEFGHVEDTEHGLRITLPFSKGDRGMKGVQVGIPYGSSELCPVRALRRWLQAASISEGAIFRRIWVTPPPQRPGTGLDTDPRDRPGRHRPWNGRSHRQSARQGRRFRRRPVGWAQPEAGGDEYGERSARPPDPAQAARPARQLRHARGLSRRE